MEALGRLTDPRGGGLGDLDNTRRRTHPHQKNVSSRKMNFLIGAGVGFLFLASDALPSHSNRGGGGRGLGES